MQFDTNFDLMCSVSVYLQDLKRPPTNKNKLKNASSFLLFLAATALVASVNTLQIEADTEATSLRSIKTAVDDGVAEKRGGFYYKFDFNLLDNIFHSLSEIPENEEGA
ncbi:hypothetical protein GQ600_17295 [Phytophthora cactorum]|nr:hypothetical protein GQ600_17295 [Phytophthora cactorum]